MTRGEIRRNVRRNLSDALITYYADEQINQSIQDAYNEIVAKTLCNIKSTTLNWPSNASNYFNFSASPFSVSDFLGTYAIFNNVTNLWLNDDLSLRDFDRIRRDWEIWRGQPQWWAPHSLKYTVIVPVNNPATGTFVLWYYAIAPVMTADTDEPIIAPDMHDLLEHYATADLLESAEEPTKAAKWWGDFYPQMESYKQRVHNLAKSQLLLRI
jgi:hypothetical protein